MGLPVGLAYDPADKIVLDPDISVREAIAHLFAAFARTGPARAVVAEFNTAGLLFPARIRKGAHKGELAWMPLRHWRGAPRPPHPPLSARLRLRERPPGPHP